MWVDKENPASPSLSGGETVGCTYAGRKYVTKLYFLTVQINRKEGKEIE